MLRSMTGYGKSECDLPGKKLTVEIKSLNSKQADINTRLPSIYREKDLEIRNLLTSNLIRGKIEFSIQYEIIDGTASIVNESVVKDYFRQLSAIAFELGIKDQDTLIPTIMRFPDTLISEKTELNKEEWMKVVDSIHSAIEELNGFRDQEGSSIEKDLLFRVNNINNLLRRIKEFETDRKKSVKERLLKNLEELISREDIDMNRYEQEIIYYIEKLDITEEKVRLENHCNYFKEVLKDEDSNGKKLGFISQEMGREINTLGSKANHADIQRLVVEMKDELEKIKEQVLNVL